MGEYARRLIGGSTIVLLIIGALVAAGTSADRDSTQEQMQARVTDLASHDIIDEGQTSVSTQAESHNHDSEIATTQPAPVLTAAAGETETVESSSPTEPPVSSSTLASTTTPNSAAPAAPSQTSTTVARGALSGDVSMTNPVVEAGARLVFDPANSATLRVRGNLTVLGVLEMHPNPDVIHRIVFEDRGELLVTRSGVLDIQGTAKAAWNRTGHDPSWRSSDELIVAPITPGDWELHPFTLGSAVPTYQGFAAEVANLSRNVIIDSPSRVMLMELDGHAPQVIKYATISNAGVRDQVSMYALHFHLNGNATRGSIVEGVVIRDSRFRAFVPHGSHGITFRDTLAVNVVANGYWWDLNRSSDSTINESHDIVYERAGVIGLTTSDPPDQGRQAGFNLGDGTGNVVRDSFVAGLKSGPNNSGFQWPEGARGVWTAQNLVAHNNKGHGFFVWQNNGQQHVIQNVDSYLNGGAGISNGAYSNSYRWVNARLVGNEIGLHLHTFSKAPPGTRQIFECMTITDSPVGVLVGLSPATDGIPTLLSNSVMQRVGQEFVVTEQALAENQTLETRVELANYQAGC